MAPLEERNLVLERAKSEEYFENFVYKIFVILANNIELLDTFLEDFVWLLGQVILAVKFGDFFVELILKNLKLQLAHCDLTRCFFDRMEKSASGRGKFVMQSVPPIRLSQKVNR